MTGKRFTAAELAYVEANYRSATHAEIGAAIGRSVKSIRNLCHKRGWVEPNEWSTDEVAQLVAFYQRPGAGGRDTLGLDSLARELGRLKSNVCRKARSLGLTKPDRGVMTAEGRQALSIRAKKMIADKGHPRGALGLVHSPETRAILSAKSRAGWAEYRARPLLQAAREERRKNTMQERYGRFGPPRTDNAYSRCKRGVREDLGFFLRSRWEANYARYLKRLQERREIRSWEYEPETFRFEGVSRGPYTYLPDFRVVEVSGAVVYHEVKGWMDPASRNRLKRFAKFYPDVVLVVIDQRAYRDIERKLSRIIPGWEFEG